MIVLISRTNRTISIDIHVFGITRRILKRKEQTFPLFFSVYAHIVKYITLAFTIKLAFS